MATRAADQVERQPTLKAAFEALQAGRFEAARDLAQPYVQERDLEALLLFGLALAGSHDAAGAAPFLTGVATARPQALHPCIDLVSLLQRQFRARDAEPAFLACLTITPTDAKLRLGYAQLLCEMGRLDEAMAEVEESLRLAPDLVAALNQKAIILAGMRRTPDALDLFRRVVERDPRNAPAWANLGCTLAGENEFEEALSAYRQSIQIKPDDAQVRLNHSICLLKAGRMVQGWQEHEWRFRLPGHTRLPLDRILPTLGPHADLAGRSVLLTHEEGVGDTLMFLRYVPLLARLGATVVAWVPQNLARVTARVEGIAGVIATDEVRLEADWHCPFISLPRAFAATPTPWGVSPPYLGTDPAEVASTSLHLPRASGSRAPLRVGLVWGGAPRPDHLPANAVDRRRSMALSQLAPLAALRDVSLVSLQYGPYARALHDPPAGLHLADPMEFVQDMDDTASLMRSLDVVVSVDTSMIHLAGGLGIPAILMDRYDNCWRWFHGRTDSPWYPSVTIVRQKRLGEWADVVERVVPMLQRMADAKQAAFA